MATFNVNEFQRKIREAQRRVEQQVNSEIDRINRANQQAVNEYNRKVEAHNKKVIADHNREVERINRTNQQAINEYNRKANEHNNRVIADLNRQLRSASGTIRYTDKELILADRIHRAVGSIDPREYDSFLSYARIDGAVVANELRSNLESFGVAVWFDEVAIVPGRSQSLQMDAGLRKARTGIAFLTPAYLAGRFWTERELGALLSKETLIPVLHNVTFEDVKQYSGILPDLAGFTTEHDSIADIAKKIAAAVLIDEDETH